MSDPKGMKPMVEMLEKKNLIDNEEIKGQTQLKEPTSLQIYGSRTGVRWWRMNKPTSPFPSFMVLFK